MRGGIFLEMSLHRWQTWCRSSPASDFGSTLAGSAKTLAKRSSVAASVVTAASICTVESTTARKPSVNLLPSFRSRSISHKAFVKGRTPRKCSSGTPSRVSDTSLDAVQRTFSIPPAMELYPVLATIAHTIMPRRRSNTKTNTFTLHILDMTRLLALTRQHRQQGQAVQQQTSQTGISRKATMSDQALISSHCGLISFPASSLSSSCDLASLRMFKILSSPPAAPACSTSRP
mmetsp:Transcript_58094/g.182345  ORF Transcript_58094/g.182345 Transcript_58094/m.182345 type:complete len:232 (-) Transcript_58094:255-950(-)